MAPATGLVIIDPSYNSQANGLNNSDVAIGLSFQIFPRTALWNSSNTLSIRFPTTISQGIAINNLGQLIGSSNSGSYYNDGISLVRQSLPLTATDINDARRIVGGNGSAAMFDVDTNTLTILGKLSPSDANASAQGINQAGTIVGNSGASGGFVADVTTHQLTQLTSVLAPAYSAWAVETATGINNVGQIIGVGVFDNVEHAIILTPVPEPSTLLLGTMAACALFVGRRRGPVDASG